MAQCSIAVQRSTVQYSGAHLHSLLQLALLARRTQRWRLIHLAGTVQRLVVRCVTQVTCLQLLPVQLLTMSKHAMWRTGVGGGMGVDWRVSLCNAATLCIRRRIPPKAVKTEQ